MTSHLNKKIYIFCQLWKIIRLAQGLKFYYHNSIWTYGSHLKWISNFHITGKKPTIYTTKDLSDHLALCLWNQHKIGFIAYHTSNSFRFQQKAYNLLVIFIQNHHWKTQLHKRKIPQRLLTGHHNFEFPWNIFISCSTT